MVGQNEVVFSSSRDALLKVNAQLKNRESGFVNTEFGQRLADAYSRGAGFLFAADLHGFINAHPARTRRGAQHLDETGFGDVHYLVVEHREVNNAPINRMVLDFAGQRHGVASWLAAPDTMGSLNFVSRNAAVAVAVISKDPQLMFDDVLAMARGDKAKQQANLSEAEAKLKLNLRNDLAAHLGGDVAIALDGPVLPTPSWKVVVEVHEAPQLAVSLQTLVQGIDAEVKSHGKPGIELTFEDVNGQRYYMVQDRESNAKALHYTFVNGYMIMGPSRAVLMNTLHTVATGDSLAQSSDFRALLPKDENANYSAIAYQNLSPILQPLLSQLSGDQVKAVQEIAADSRPSVICAWGRDNRIEAISNSRLLGFDWMALGTLLSHGTSHRQTP
jgi:hypothetical protein